MKSLYRVMWTYLGNYSDVVNAFEAYDFQDAIERHNRYYGYSDNEEFCKKATFHVTDAVNAFYRAYRNGECIKEGCKVIRMQD